MNKNLKVLLTVAVVIAIAGSYYFPQVQQTVNQVLGAVPTLDGVDHPYVTVNGHKEWRGRVPMAATSSVICNFPNPFNATSTWEGPTAKSTNVGIAQANNVFVATTSSVSRFATTSVTALSQGFAMGTGQWSFSFVGNVATSTSAAEELGAPVNVLEGANANQTSNYILGPTENLVFIIATSTPGTFVTYDQGFCSTVIREL